MKTLLLAAALLALPSLASAQAAAPTDKFQWTTPDTPAARVQAFRWDLELDGVVLPTPLVATCAGAAVTCQAAIPAVTPTTHTVRVRPVDTSGATPIVGPFSDPTTFTMRATPAKPGPIVLIPGL